MANWRDFRSQYIGLFRDVDQQYPEFWAALGDLIEGHRRQRYTTRGAHVREFPDTREQGTQTPVMPRMAIETQTPRSTLQTAETQTPLPQTHSPFQRTTGTQVEIVTPTWDMAPAQAGVLATIALPKGRGRGLRPLRPEEIRLTRPGELGLHTEVPRLVLPREAPGPSLPKSPSRRTTRRSLSPGKAPRQRTPERRGRSPARRPKQGP